MKIAILALLTLVGLPIIAYAQETQAITGCICEIDQAKQTLSIMPWDSKTKSLDSNNIQLFIYADSTSIIGVNTIRVADFKAGKVLKGIKIEKMEVDNNGQISKIVGTPIDIRELSKLTGRKATISWVNKEDKRLCEKIKLAHNFPRESFSATTSLETGRSQVIMSNQCECAIEK